MADSGPTPRIVVVDDDRAVRAALTVNLSKEGFDVRAVDSARAALALVEERETDLVITDVAMPQVTGMELLAELKRRFPEVRVVMMTGYGSVQDAVAAMKAGADDYIIKPVSKDELMVIVQRALAERALLAELRQLRREVQEKYGFENIIGASPAMLEVYELIDSVATTDATVLVTGPTGTGKELISSAIHYRSGRRNGPFIKVNCAALPESLLESELFGHEKGSFTGAIRQHRGRFEQAHGGTLMLDEIGELSLATQSKLLRALESGEINRVGGTETIKVDVRLLAATNRDLAKEVEAGRFREDLFFRLDVFTIRVPALKERREDLPLLVDTFVKRFAQKHGRRPLSVPPATMQRMMDAPWPGNVRELMHVIERAVILSRGDELVGVRLSEGPAPVQDGPSDGIPAGMALQDALLAYERKVIIDALKNAKGVQAQAARDLGISRSNLNYRISRLGIQVKDVVYE